VTAALGPYFVWQPYAAGEGWRPYTELLEDPAVVTERVDVARRALVTMFGLAEDTVPVRVVASVTFLGVASRLVSPLLADALTGGVLRAPAPADLWWKPVPGGPWPMACGPVPTRPASADALREIAVEGLVAPLLKVFGARFRLSPRVLWGNVASALAGAAGQLPAGLDARDAWPVLAALLERPPLAGMAVLERFADRHFLVRRNCCLYYRIPGGGTCGDCVLTPEPVRRQQWQSIVRR
jgi:hypothetical protein